MSADLTKHSALVHGLADVDNERTRDAKLRRTVARLSEDDVRALALRVLREDVQAERRQRALAIERAAYQQSPEGQEQAHRQAERSRSNWERAKQRKRDEQAARDAGYESPLAHSVARMHEAVEEWANHIRMEWTKELRGSDFALRDGSRVTWGAATVEQHTERRAMFADNARANLEGAARHEQAIRALTAAGAATLNDLVQQEAAA